VVDPLLFSLHDGRLRTDYEAAEIPIVVGAPIEPAARVKHMGQLIRQSGAEVLHVSTVDLAWAVLAAAQVGLPSLWHIAEGVGWYDYFRRLPVADAVAALQALALPYRVIFGSMVARTRWLPLERTGNFCVIHRGFDAEHFSAQLGALSRADARRQLGIPEHQLVLLTLGEGCSSKRLQDLVQAIAALDDVAPQVRLMIVGDRPSPDSAHLHALVDRLPSARRPDVTSVPETVDVAPLWRAADIFCCVDTSASFPRGLQEAMACGLPIIAPSTYGIPEMVQPGYNAECYPAGDVKALTTAIKRLATDAALRQSYAANAPIQLASAFSFAEMLSALGRLLGEARLTATTPVAPLAATDRFTLGSIAGKAELLRVAVAAALHQNRYSNQGGNGLR
jgi:glycosyltransferase involved in cell wall biosynthesis